MVDSMAVDPDDLADPKLIRILIQNAKREGRDDLVLKCQVRLARLEGAKFNDPLEREFWSAVAAAEEVASATDGRTTRLTRTRQKVRRVGIRKCLEDWASQKGNTPGFAILVEGGHPELTGEAIVVRHAAEFSTEVVAAARQTLLDHGIDPSRI